jgi:hypothetical protein
MKTILNKSRKPIRVPLPGNKVLHLGPLKIGQIADQHAQAPGVQRLLQKGDIEIVGEAAHPEGGDGSGATAHERTHGHKPPTVVLPKGNR